MRKLPLELGSNVGLDMGWGWGQGWGELSDGVP